MTQIYHSYTSISKISEFFFHKAFVQNVHSIIIYYYPKAEQALMSINRRMDKIIVSVSPQITKTEWLKWGPHVYLWRIHFDIWQN